MLDRTLRSLSNLLDSKGLRRRYLSGRALRLLKKSRCRLARSQRIRGLDHLSALRCTLRTLDCLLIWLAHWQHIWFAWFDIACFEVDIDIIRWKFRNRSVT